MIEVSYIFMVIQVFPGQHFLIADIAGIFLRVNFFHMCVEIRLIRQIVLTY